MILALEIETPVIFVDTNTPDVVQINADATILVTISPGINAMITPINDVITADGSSDYALPNVPFTGSELILVNGSWQKAGVDYQITGTRIYFLAGGSPAPIPPGMQILVHGWKI